ncbi:MAG: hypothetical protein IJW28_05885 [Clostridia bacterium]|nr:hypothetical protein [Clostridia bacterium]
MAEKDFVVGNGNLDSMILSTMETCASKGVMPVSFNVSELLVKQPKMFETVQKTLSTGKVFMKSGKTMETLVIGGDSKKLPKDAISEFYTTLQGRLSKLPNVENAPSVLEFIDSALRQCEAFRVTSVVTELNALKSRLLSTVMSTGSVAEAEPMGLEPDAVSSVN